VCHSCTRRLISKQNCRSRTFSTTASKTLLSRLWTCSTAAKTVSIRYYTTRCCCYCKPVLCGYQRRRLSHRCSYVGDWIGGRCAGQRAPRARETFDHHILRRDCQRYWFVYSPTLHRVVVDCNSILCVCLMTGKICYGVADTLTGLDMGAVKKLIGEWLCRDVVGCERLLTRLLRILLVWENLEVTRHTCRSKESGEEVILHLTPAQEKNLESFRDEAGGMLFRKQE